MKKILIIVLLALTACSQSKPHQRGDIKAKQTKQCKYICIMDKDVCAEGPGICPKCGMQLLEKENK